MVFSSAIFLFLFLPFVLLGHWLVGRRLRNIFLLSASLIFYAWGEGVYVLMMLLSIACNYAFGRILDDPLLQGQFRKRRKLLLFFMLLANLLPLFYFKYYTFFLNNFSSLFGNNSDLISASSDIHLPIGISFFTFQAMSYLIDVYRKVNKAQRSVLAVGLYISLFPQLIAGPIVRYASVAEQLKSRIQSIALFSSGVERFIYGLAKKMLIANQLGYVADAVFALPSAELTFTTAWLGVLCYTLQIYFDFSGYSDMAIGLGRMLGFRFQENFNFPYIATSIREFWHRWHISLSSWFRDYVYIPLGGNRYGKLTTTRNLIIVYLVCGLWHGASWNFIIWGLLHGAFLALERGSWGKVLHSLPRVFQHMYVSVVILSTFVFFRAETLNSSLGYLSAMFSWDNSLAVHTRIAIELDIEFYLTLCSGILISTPIFGYVSSRLRNQQLTTSSGNCVATLSSHFFKITLLMMLLALASMEIANGSYNPFIYFRF